MAFTRRLRLAFFGPAHPVALLALVLLVGAGLVGAHVRRGDGVVDWWVHALLGLQLGLVPLLYGLAHNAERPFGKAVVLLFLVGVTIASGFLYSDLAGPRDVPVPDGFRPRGGRPWYYAPPAMLWAASMLLAGHWAHGVVRRIRRARARRRAERGALPADTP